MEHGAIFTATRWPSITIERLIHAGEIRAPLHRVASGTNDFTADSNRPSEVAQLQLHRAVAADTSIDHSDVDALTVGCHGRAQIKVRIGRHVGRLQQAVALVDLVQVEDLARCVEASRQTASA